MERKWTPAQSAAMSTRGRTLLISAAAGSGKTATLTERVIRRLTDPESPAELSRMLIVTFTRAAAAELKERIAGALSDAIAKDPANRHLQKQLIGLSSAHISTIDSFYREPVKTHFAELGQPASTRIADEGELAPLKERIMGELIDEFYISYGPTTHTGELFGLLWHNRFAALCDSLTSSKNDADLIPTLLDLYERLLSFPKELLLLKEEAEELREALSRQPFEFFDTRHGSVIRDWTRELASSGRESLTEALELIETDAAAAKAYAASFRYDLETCEALLDCSTYAAARELLMSYKGIRLGPLRNADPCFVTCKETRTEITDGIKTLLKKYYVDSPEALVEQIRETADMCEMLYLLLDAYDRRIAKEKNDRGICDFTDNRRQLLHLLQNPDGTPTPFAEEMAALYDEVYIDEYQDVDESQDTIFSLVGGDHRFMVGDIKQSIYGFRGADPSVFARYRSTMTKLEPGQDPTAVDPTPGNSIFMSDNFRCDESVIRVTNAVCGHIFAACPDSIGYTPDDDLGFSKRPPSEEYVSPPVGIHLLTKADGSGSGELDGAEAEATYVANLIAELLRRGEKKADGTPITPGDIVILMRTRTALPLYMQALTAMGIPTGSEELDAMEARKDLLHGSDMTYLLNLLRVIDDPDDDIPLSEILRAPFPGLDLDELLAVRRVGDRSALSFSLYGGVESYGSLPERDPTLADKLNDFTAWLEHYRRLCATLPADGIIRLLGRDERVACRRTPAYRYLYEAARTYKTLSFPSLHAFLRFFTQKRATATVASAERDQNTDHVSIMTIHKSKGLEFPVCFVVRCGQSFSARSYSGDLLFAKSTGIAMKLYSRREEEGTRDQKKRDTTLRAATSLAIRKTEREEEMRILYVAMTRARERLYLVGCGSEENSGFRRGDRYATLSKSCYMKWILAGMESCPEVADHREIICVPADTVVMGERLCLSASADTAVEEDPNAAYYRRLKALDRDPTPLEVLLRRVPTKVPASRMKPRMLDTCVFYETDIPEDDGKLPGSETNPSRCDAQTVAGIRESLRLMASSGADEFELLLSENRRPTATERGTATHLFLQYCDYRLVARHGPEEEIARLTEEGFLSSRTARILDRDALNAFFQSDFFRRVGEAERILREQRFARFVPLSRLTDHTELAEALGDRTLFVQGSIDLLCEFPDGRIEIADYKTDRLLPGEAEHPERLRARMMERHGDQLAQYAAAVEDMYGKRPDRVYIYSIPLGEALEMDVR